MNPTQPIVIKARQEASRSLIGKEDIVQSLLYAFLTNQHAQLLGPPGTAKSYTSRTMAQILLGKNVVEKRTNLPEWLKKTLAPCIRIQFTPDMMPGDIIGSLKPDIDDKKNRSYAFEPGPILRGVILHCDEVNRAGPKVHSALLSAMAERKICVGVNTIIKTPDHFWVMCTSNPLDMEGTFALGEAFNDRIGITLMDTLVEAPNVLEVIKRESGSNENKLVIPEDLECQIGNYPSEIDSLQRQILGISLSKQAAQAILNIIYGTYPVSLKDEQAKIKNIYGDITYQEAMNVCSAFPKLKSYHVYFRTGLGIRAGIALSLLAKAHVWAMTYPNYREVQPKDIFAIAKPVLRHRIQKTYQADADCKNMEEILMEIVQIASGLSDNEARDLKKDYVLP